MGLQASTWSVAGAYRAMKERFAIGRVRSGHMRFRIGRRIVDAHPGTLLLGRPGDVHQKTSGEGVIDVLSFGADDAALASLQIPRFVERRMVPAIDALYAAFDAKADRLAMDVATEEALAALAGLTADGCDYSRPVRSAIDMLTEQLAAGVTLDDLALHTGLEKFRLCRAFRTQVGMPPHAYQTHLRVLEAKRLLEAGAKPADVARRVGFYDQSRLNRHFRRILGVTPGALARRVR